MPRFKVALYAPGAETPSVFREIWAEDVEGAAQVVAGARLGTKGKLEDLRAVAWPLKHPADRTSFYAPTAPADSPVKPKRRTRA